MSKYPVHWRLDKAPALFSLGLMAFPKTIYQVNLRSFKDTNSDGIGDFVGLISNFSYIAELGVDAIWLSPFFQSPMIDFGYDVSDYLSVNPDYGSLEDLRALIDIAHESQIKVICDLPLSHTSDQHPWFVESSSSTINSKSDWYVWTDGPDLPNNWLSAFGGSAWQWSETRQQFFLHNFLKEQPDLNYHNKDVQNAVLDLFRFWLDFGVDGFRLDACNCYFHNKSLLSNPESDQRAGDVQDPTNPYFHQIHLHDKSQPENLDFLKRVRGLIDEYRDRFLIGEIFCDFEEETTRLYSENSYPLHSTYNFSLLKNHREPGLLRNSLLTYQSVNANSAWCLSNHDVKRVVTRWEYPIEQTDRAKAYQSLLLGLPGSVIVYQGEELGLTESLIPSSDRLDPFGALIESEYPGRDGCRTPFPWESDANNLGFSLAKPWLPTDAGHAPLAVNLQQRTETSSLHHFRQLTKIRRESQCLQSGDTSFWFDDDNLLVYSRSIDGESLLVVVSFSDSEAELHNLGPIRILETVSKGLRTPQKGHLVIDPYGFGWVQL